MPHELSDPTTGAPDDDVLDSTGRGSDWRPWQTRGDPLRFSIGDRVRCVLGPAAVRKTDGKIMGRKKPAEDKCTEMNFGSGTVVALEYHEPEWPDDKVVPYQVLLDTGRMIYAPVDEDDTIHAHQRFQIDSGVLCNMGSSEDPDFRPGTILQLEYVDAKDGDWTEWVYYQVHLKSGHLICVPSDEDSTIKLDPAAEQPPSDIDEATHLKVIQDILSSDPSMGINDRGTYMEGRTLLALSCGRPHTCCLRAVELLLERGADANLQDREGKTALMLAAHWGHASVVTALLKAGAQIQLRDQQGGTALRYAEKRQKLGDGRCIAAIRAHLQTAAADRLAASASCTSAAVLAAKAKAEQASADFDAAVEEWAEVERLSAETFVSSLTNALAADTLPALKDAIASCDYIGRIFASSLLKPTFAEALRLLKEAQRRKDELGAARREAKQKKRQQKKAAARAAQHAAPPAEDAARASPTARNLLAAIDVAAPPATSPPVASTEREAVGAPPPAEESPEMQPSAEPEDKLRTQMKELEPGPEVADAESCVICMDAKITHLFAPCGHFCVCESCCKRVSDDKQKCPMCNAAVAMGLKLFKP